MSDQTRDDLLDAIARACMPLNARLYSSPKWEVGSVLRMMLDAGGRIYTIRVDMDYAPISTDTALLTWVRQVVDLELLWRLS